jgi:curved DNA-binding protein CbpA
MAIAYDPEADHYVALGIQSTATAEDIKKAHRARIRDLHPDRGGDTTRATAANIARAVLLDPAIRREYDQSRREWMWKSYALAFADAARDAEQYAHAATQASAAESRQGTTAATSTTSTTSATSASVTSSPSRPHTTSEERQNRAWRWGLAAEYAWDDVRKIFKSGDWLGAVGLLGTTLFADYAIQQHAEPELLAKFDAALAAKRRERAMEFIESAASALGVHFGVEFIESAASALGVHFGLDSADAAARAGTAARNAAPTTARSVSRRRGTRKRNGTPGAGAARTRPR